MNSVKQLRLYTEPVEGVEAVKVTLKEIEVDLTPVTLFINPEKALCHTAYALPPTCDEQVSGKVVFDGTVFDIRGCGVLLQEDVL